MTIKSEQQKIFNGSLKTVEATNKKILQAYKDSLKVIKAKLDEYNRVQAVNFGLKNAKNIMTAQEVRLTLLYKEVSQEITKLTTKYSGYIASGYNTVYTDTYYQMSYVTEKEVNRLLISGNITVPSLDGVKNISLNYPLLNTEAVRQSFNEVIAGETFKQRILKDRKYLQSKIQSAVARAIIEGQSAKDLQKAITKLDESYLANAGSAESTARTELLRAHSLADEQSIDEAVKAGVDVTYFWNASLDSKTRLSHAQQDGKQATIDKGLPLFIVGGVRLSSPRLVRPDNTVNSAGQVISCRCYRENAPFGISPTKRLQKLDDSWVETDKNKSYSLWLADLKKQNITPK